MHVYYDNVLIYDSGPGQLHSNQVAIPFGPGASTNLVIIMNEGNNTDTNTLWEYTATVACPAPAYVVFTENTNLAPVPIKFASPPFLPDRHEPGPLLPARAIAQHPRRRECLWHLATGDVGHARRGGSIPRRRSPVGSCASSFRTPRPCPLA